MEKNRRVYKVRKVLEDCIEIVPFDESQCAGCQGSCSECHEIILTATNPKKLELKPGMKVRTNISTPLQKITNALALLVPVAGAVAGFFVSSPFAEFLKKENTESFKSSCVLIGLAIPALIIFIATRKKSSVINLQISQIL